MVRTVTGDERTRALFERGGFVQVLWSLKASLRSPGCAEREGADTKCNSVRRVRRGGDLSGRKGDFLGKIFGRQCNCPASSDLQ